ncbi:MAG: OmpA family protein [Deltaproteobacteria bacterium]|nr:OmpA family protein [Deltaproteobacteria bacterium]
MPHAAPTRPTAVITTTLILASFLLTPSSRAQSAGGAMDIQLFRPAIDSKGLITLNASEVLRHLDVSFGLVVNYARRPFAVSKTGIPNVRGESLYAIDHLGTGNLQAAIGLFRYVEVGVGMPFTFWSGDTDPNRDDGTMGLNPNQGGIDAQGAGDLAVHVKGRILSTSKFPLGLALMASLTLPTGGENTFLGEGRVTFTPTVIVDKDFFRGRLRVAANLGARLRFGNTSTWTDDRSCEATGTTFSCGTGLVLQTKHRLQYGVGAAFAAVPQRLDIVAEVVGQVGLGGTSDVGRSAHEILAGLRLYLAKNSYMTLGAGRGLRGGWGDTNKSYGSPDLRAFLGFVFEPNIGDRDGDGLKDDIDRCPLRPEDFDGFEDKDGCPDLDNDKDGILDIDDKCPNEPEDKDGFEDEDGCPEPNVLDRDGDGIPDNLDKCPDDPEDKDGFEDGDGCPDPDNDKDGILDIDDLCPNKPEDRDGFEDKDGCPDPDNDKDRILDVDDKCPNEPENYNSYQDEDGCPDKLVRIGKGKVFVMKKIFFETASAVIRKESYKTLDAVAQTLRENPQILKIEIQGHADERGSDGYNLRLTTARARSVRQYLVTHGITPRRLDARGYGKRKPKDRGHSEEAWSRNRRVEFVIKKRI